MTTYSLTELLEKLNAEHDSSCYYRGQNQNYEQYPLWPSMYRKSRIIKTFEISQSLSLYKRGSYFGFRSNQLIGTNNNTEYLKLRELKRCMMGYVRNALGYCLSEAMFQQAGWESEGLDITGNINIALFFAMHNYVKGKYKKNTSLDTKVLYRWKLPKDNWSLETLNSSNYYKCPALFPSKDILNLFDECESEHEFLDSIENYKNEIGWGDFNFEYSNIQGKRPYNLIKIPYKWKQFSRIVSQDASLLFPDYISLDNFNNQFTFRDKECQDIISYGGLFVEDLSTAFDCEKFFFTIKPDDFKMVDIDESKIYINDDFSHLFLAGWMKSFHQHPSGTPRMMMSIDDNYLSKIDEDLNLSELRFCNNEERFNG